MRASTSGHLRRQAGLSLVEVLIASTILGLVTTAMMAVVSNVSRLDAGADELRQARIFLHEETEDPYRHYSRYGAIVGYPNYPDLHLDAHPETGYAGVPADASVDVADPGPILINGVSVPFRRVQATMTWSDPDNGARSLVLRKLVTNLVTGP